jgi:hypothetical protein
MPKSQCQRIVDYLVAHPGRGITALEATQLSPPIMRLTNRISELESAGVTFLRVDDDNVMGVGKHMRYHLLSLDKWIDHPYKDAINDAQMARL